jgi:ribonucleoside-triphosphate reductase (thioredoxin)
MSVYTQLEPQETIDFLSGDFLKEFEDFPQHMNALGKFVYLRTYSRYLPEEGRRENWRETCARAVNYNVSLSYHHLKKLKTNINYSALVKEAKRLFKSMYNLQQFLSGRTLWVGGAEGGVADKYPLANFNCSFTTVRSFDDLADIFYLLLVGTGAGIKATKKMARQLPKVNINIEAYNEPYNPKPSYARVDNTMLIMEQVYNEDGTKEEVARIVVGDSKEGWVESLRYFFNVISKEEYRHIKKIVFNYDNVRPKGERLKTFGGTASGPRPLMEMYDGFLHVLRNQMDDFLAPIEVDENGLGQLRPVHILDFANLIGNNVVVGGVRRTAEIFLFDADDYECMFAKYGIYGIWNEENHNQVISKLEGLGLYDWADKLRGMELFNDKARPLTHRSMSNNSIAFTSKPTRKFLNLVFTLMKGMGEPGFINLYEAALRRLKGRGIFFPTQQQLEDEMEAIGLNPCAEILLHYYGVCNLTTVNVVAFVRTRNDGTKYLDVEGLLQAQRDSARAGLRMTLVELELKHWDDIQQMDRLLGTSVTGWKDAMDQLGYTEEQENELKALMGDTSRNEAEIYATEMEVNIPLLANTVKPEGTLSQVAGGVSSGVHYAHSEYYFRRVRINADDPLAKAVLAHEGWRVWAEVGTEYNGVKIYDEETLAKPEVILSARTLVIDFPIYSGAKITKDEATIDQQFDNYFAFQEHYCDHNASNTMTVKPHEWDRAEEIVWDGWDNFTAVSFLAHDGGDYKLAPYKSCSQEEYETYKAGMTDFNMDILGKYEVGILDESTLTGMEGCEGGACGIR